MITYTITFRGRELYNKVLDVIAEERNKAQDAFDEQYNVDAVITEDKSYVSRMRRGDLVLYLKNNPGWHTAADIAEKNNASERINDTLRALANDNKISRKHADRTVYYSYEEVALEGGFVETTSTAKENENDSDNPVSHEAPGIKDPVIETQGEVKENVPVVKKRKRSGTLDFYTPHMWRVKILDCIMKGTPNHNYSAQELIDIFGIKGQRDACAHVTQFCTDLARACPGCVDKYGKPGNYSYTFNPTEKFMKRVSIGEELIRRIDKDGAEELDKIKTYMVQEYQLDNSEIMFIGKLAVCYITNRKGMQPEVQG